ncbi:CRISPR-associated protein [Lentilactobacillus otakiensis DSM 19908 = JCM 15040]|uniref:CRISPR system casD CASCADE complex protein n=2 Tax=Lentilactobacillus otakiensis TaxID=481720 RepID=S4PQB2_9LACO|nr:CRISPR-associated protein [Lentilactobacillus otakiensis DSM 19908 = JCM 15040]GAD17060.1 CRISPR system casD CASCADE complex protein [Lentilactobacillus otakiensis DSM 19908 = JCM 15040]
MQSYGNEASFNRRTSWDYPSKSAVIGMIAAAMGYQRNDKRIVQLNKLNFAVRVDQPGQIMTDFQIVEWDQKAGKRQLSYREYLQDAVFIVALGSEDDQLIDNIEFALKRPYFPLFLGRRANVPAGVLNLKSFPDEGPIDVLKHLQWQASTWYQKRLRRKSEVPVDIVADADLLHNVRTLLVKDRVKSFDQRNRQYGFRKTGDKTIVLTNPHAQKANPETGHDIFGAV